MIDNTKINTSGSIIDPIFFKKFVDSKPTASKFKFIGSVLVKWKCLSYNIPIGRTSNIAILRIWVKNSTAFPGRRIWNRGISMIIYWVSISYQNCCKVIYKKKFKMYWTLKVYSVTYATEATIAETNLFSCLNHGIGSRSLVEFSANI